jgi:hypothetical protein
MLRTPFRKRRNSDERDAVLRAALARQPLGFSSFFWLRADVNRPPTTRPLATVVKPVTVQVDAGVFRLAEPAEARAAGAVEAGERLRMAAVVPPREVPRGSPRMPATRQSPTPAAGTRRWSTVATYSDR